ncbi:MAG: DNA mismatch repair endonuclease MutL [Ruminococcus sp.]|nr:DNA mismatch repair endonuclease MutL [Ruminococcus sp.]
MGVINVLDKHVAELIAAGEVVERPASVIKELVENAIDAGAKNITVEIKNGGTTFMRVTDDGCGIFKDDIKVAFLRHATSKVKLENDLGNISTLGFRGEALASICAVSKLQLITRNKNEEIGTSYEIDGGEEISFDDAGCPVGTTFVIRDLFYNIPARAKFLKKDIAEGNAVSNIIDKTALSHPEIAFTYIRDSKQVLKTFGDGKLMSAIYSVFGREFANGLIAVDYTLDFIKVSGFISKPVNSRPNRNMQNFFINGRYVKTRTAMCAVEEAFKHSVMVGKFPSCVLNIELPFDMIDVNVHPAKIEVRFTNERPVFDAVYHAVKSSLMKFDDRKNASFNSNNNSKNDNINFNPFNNAPAILNKQPEKTQVSQTKKSVDTIKTSYQNNSQDFSETDKTVTQNDEYNPFDLVQFRNDNESKKKLIQSNNLPDFDEGIRVTDIKNPLKVYSDMAIRDNAKKEKIKENIDKKFEKNVSNEIKKYNFLGNIPENSDNKPDINKAAEPNQEINILPLISSETENKYTKPIITQNDVNIRYIGEAFSTYIIAEKNNKEILFIDKHAAHERMIYEKLKAEKAGSSAQILLQPVTVNLGKEEYLAAVENLDMFAECSFEVDDFGNSSVIVRSAPQYIDAAEIADCITEMADYIAKGKTDIYTEKMDWFYHNVACRSAIKAGNKSTPQELLDIVKRLEENPEIKYCPHGRPVCIVMKKSEIERQFGRA